MDGAFVMHGGAPARMNTLPDGERTGSPALAMAGERETSQQDCPSCGQRMPALKGARWAICPTCGYKESCCY